MKNFETFKIKKETLADHVGAIKNTIEKIYNQEKAATPEQILETKLILEKIPNLVINFDETLTAKDTIAKTIEYLIEALPEDLAREVKERRIKFGSMIKEYRTAKEKGIKPEIAPVKYFYENVIKGISADVLDKVYDHVISDTELNPNLEKVFEYLKKELKVETIPLFALSLNNKELIKKFYKKISIFSKNTE